jgi:hypothetical protein
VTQKGILITEEGVIKENQRDDERELGLKRGAPARKNTTGLAKLRGAGESAGGEEIFMKRFKCQAREA